METDKAENSECEHASAETAPVRPKTADRPHGWTIALSISALVVSILSLCQAHKAVETSAATAHAVVQATALKLTRDPRQMSFLTVDLTLMNYGAISARNLTTAFEWEVSKLAVPIATPSYFQPPHHDLAPKSYEVVRLQGNRRFTGGRGLG
jgi:hypothetical protein